MEASQSHLDSDAPPEFLLLDDPDADIILRSSDLREFRLLKRDITRISPVLDDLIRSSTSNSSNSSVPSHAKGLPCVQISENGDILSSLLSFILPVSPVLPTTTETIMELLSVAQRYKMKPTLAHIRGAVALKDSPFIRPESAFHIYFLARKYGLDQEVVRAARMALTFPMTIEGLEDKFDTIPGAHLHILWKYCQTVCMNLRSDLQVFRTHELGAHRTLAGQHCQTSNGSGIPAWLDIYIASIGEDPSLFSLSEFHMCLTRHTLSSFSGCTSCKNMATETISAFWNALTTVVDNSMKNGEQDLRFGEEEKLMEGVSSGPGNSHFGLDLPHSDVILQSSNLVNFRVNKVGLSVSSSFFADMFSLPQPADDEDVDGLPVVRLPEDAETLNGLLTVLYPVPSVVPTSYDKALQLLAAAQKYDMAGVQSSIRTEIKSWGPIVPTGAVAYRAYAISSRAKLLPEMEASARHTLDFPLTLEYLSDELPLFEGWALRDLVRYRRRCRDTLVSTLQSFLDSTAAPSNIWVVCPGPMTQNDLAADDYYRATAVSKKSRHNTTVQAPVRSSAVFPEWLREIFSRRIQRLQETFTDPLLKPSSIRGTYFFALNTHIRSKNCDPCSKVHALKGETFCGQLENGLAQALEKVSASS
ncbi:hypothetical protein EI94DRAFT_1814944 [Lactarius quietus]|nr:hypothetical protein EI94DRAFT_1814944 [Lactarius quietus]